ncbi:type IV secretion system DNA-binding domain-containing protein [Candidatus Dojkabacteria bacterium]|uniref:Type IV secretion system DNA-binding domain-containing protein n=1 Tax=Candidatus Dojkabacteria bacterium TaxID=2099670 RepID=A0A955I5T8_9BACT|nr:type IV secretion system DNA-binding domain-containing protein [Candidatus Dojkabacteria bacterium]
MNLVPILIITFLAFLLISWWQLRHNYLRTKVNEQTIDLVVLKIAVPKNNKKSPLAAEQLFSALHGISLGKSKSTDHFSLEIAAGNYGVHFICIVGRQYKTFFENQVYAQYPEAQISEVGDYAGSLASDESSLKIAELKLAKEPFFPIRTFSSFDVDPLASITGAVGNLPAGHEVFIQIIARPVADSWQQAGKQYVESKKNKTDDDGKKVGLESGDADLIKLVETKNSKVGFQFAIRILAKTPDKASAGRLVNEVVAAFGQYRTAVYNSLVIPRPLKGWPAFKQNARIQLRQVFLGKRLGEKLSALERFAVRYLDEFTAGIINTEELASLYHLPNESVETPNIAWAAAKQLEYPLNLPTPQEGNVIGETDYRGIHIPFGIRPLDRLRHMYIIGKTGTGKSTFMENLIIQDLYAGNGVGVVDPHGETIHHILEQIPPQRKDDVILFAPGDTEHPLALNLVEARPGEDKSLIADGLVSVFKKEFVNSWGPRLEYILTNTLLTLLHCQNVSLLAVPRILSDDNYRKFLLKQLKDPILLKFWEEEYEAIAADPRRRSEEISSILNKIGRFTTNPMIRNIIGQISSSINFREAMDQGKILLVDLSQGKVGEENMALLGGMIVTRIYSNVTQRTNVDISERRPFYLYIDEFQNFSNPTFEKILSEARKYGLSLTIAHQFIEQIEPGIRNAIFGNVGTLINFAVGPHDADYLVKEYAPALDAEDLVNLGKYRFVTKVSIDQAQSRPFTAKSMPPIYPKTNISEDVIDTSRQSYAKPRGIVEQKIYKWASQKYNREGNLVQAELQNKPEKPTKVKKQPEKRTSPVGSDPLAPATEPVKPKSSGSSSIDNFGRGGFGAAKDPLPPAN